MPRMGRFPPFGKRFFRLARKRLGSCQFEHFWRSVIALASLQEGRSLSRFQEASNDRRSRQAISSFLTLAEWNAIAATDGLGATAAIGLSAGRCRLSAARRHPEAETGQADGRCQQDLSACRKGLANGHTILAAALVYRGVVLPCAVKLWASRRSCQESQAEPESIDRLEFRSLTGMAADVIMGLQLPEGARPIVLFDSFYLCHEVTQACEQRGWKYVGVAKKNRNFFPDGRPRDRRKLGTYGREVLRRDGRSMKVRGKKHRLAERVGHLKHLGRVKLVFSRRPRDAAWVCLVTNETRWSMSTVLSHYLRRWGIEVFFKMSKQKLGLGDYPLLRYRGIERYLCLVLIAYLLLTHLALDAPDAQATRKTRADLRLPSVPQLQQVLRRHLWNHVLHSLAKNKSTRRAAQKLKEAIQL